MQSSDAAAPLDRENAAGALQELAHSGSEEDAAVVAAEIVKNGSATGSRRQMLSACVAAVNSAFAGATDNNAQRAAAVFMCRGEAAECGDERVLRWLSTLRCEPAEQHAAEWWGAGEHGGLARAVRAASRGDADGLHTELCVAAPGAARAGAAHDVMRHMCKMYSRSGSVPAPEIVDALVGCVLEDAGALCQCVVHCAQSNFCAPLPKLMRALELTRERPADAEMLAKGANLATWDTRFVLRVLDCALDSSAPEAARVVLREFRVNPFASSRVAAHLADKAAAPAPRKRDDEAVQTRRVRRRPEFYGDYDDDDDYDENQWIVAVQEIRALFCRTTDGSTMPWSRVMLKAMTIFRGTSIARTEAAVNELLARAFDGVKRVPGAHTGRGFSIALRPKQR